MNITTKHGKYTVLHQIQHDLMFDGKVETILKHMPQRKGLTIY